MPLAAPLHRAVRTTLLVALAVYLFWLTVNHAGIQLRSAVDGAALLLFALTAALLSALRGLRLSGGSGLRERLFWLTQTAGLALLALEGMRWWLQSFGRSLPAGLPWRDLFLLIALVCFLAALMLRPRRPHPQLLGLPILIDLFITASALLAIAWIVLLQPLVQLSITYPPALAYPAIGLVLLLAILLIFLSNDPRALPSPPGWLNLSALAFALAAIGQSFLQLFTPTLSGWLSGASWVLGCTFAALNALQPPRTLTFRDPRTVRRLARMQAVLPHILTLLLGVGLLLGWLVLGSGSLALLWLLLLLSLGVIVRELLQAGQLRFQQYANLVNSIAEPSFVCDEAGLLRLINPALLSVSGYPTSRALLGQPLHLLLESAAGTEHMLAQAMARQVQPGDTVPLGWSGETLLRRRDGDLIPVYLSLRPVMAWDELPLRGSSRLAVAGTAHDLSQQKKQQAALQQAYQQLTAAHNQLSTLNAELEQKVAEETANLSSAYLRLEEQNRKLQMLDQLKSDFVSLVSHELRAPLTNISGGIELVLSRPTPLEPGVLRNLELVQSEILRLTRFVETILDLSALDAGRLPLYPAPVWFENVVTTLQGQLSHLPGLTRIRWQAPPNLPYLMADERALTSVLFHLLDNAMKYAPSGEITVSAAVQDGKMRVEVCDRGPGIAPEALPLLFDRFYRSNSHDSQTIYGHGLGLYIVRRMLEAMHGRVEASNRPDGGACFTCWLELAEQFQEEYGQDFTGR